MGSPLLVLFAGVNGAGKSTLYRSGIWEHDRVGGLLPRINSDEVLVAQGGNPNSQRDQMKAGRECVRLVHAYLDALSPFCQETTLTGRSIMHTLRRAHECGYYIVMYYLGLESADIANQRIAHRGSLGGHVIDPDTVARRYCASLLNVAAAIPFCNEAYLYDNTALMSLIARFDCGELAYMAHVPFGINWHLRVFDRLDIEEIAF